AAVSFWLLWGAIHASRLCRAAAPAPEFARQALEALARHLARSDRVKLAKIEQPRLLVSRQIHVAAAWGLLRPTILLPVEALDDEARAALDALLAHEWAHIRRRDLWLL